MLSGDGGDDWQYRFAESDGARVVHHGDTFDAGAVRFQVLHTPGHTPEHISFLVTDTAASERPVGLVTGDFIFVGDVGRPDLLERAAQQTGTMEALAHQLFRSLQATRDLPDYLQIWPGHGAGSACGKALGAMPSSTLGFERIANWAFQISEEAAFVREVLAGQPEPPRYFATMKAVNRDGPPPVPHGAIPELDLHGVRRVVSQGASLVDVRSTADFAAGHVGGALNIPVGSSFTTWAGWLLPYDRDIVLLADDADRLARARRALSLIGLDRVIGYAGAAFREAWKSECGPLLTVEEIDVRSLANGNQRTIVDVRGASEWDEGHLPNAKHLFLGNLVELTKDLPRDMPLALQCQGGTRSAIAASLLQAQGFTRVANARGGFREWSSAGLPVVRDD
jgi:hydroxyacylglutathione hydrolase